MLPGPPPVTRCNVCLCILEQFNLFSSLSGRTPVSVQCNSVSGCTCALPISSSTPDTQTHIVVAHGKDSVRSLLGNRPNHSSCLLVSSRNASGLQNLFRGCTLLHKFESATPLGMAINAHAKPSPILLFHVPPDTRAMGNCHVLAQAALERSQLDMVFRGSVKSHDLKCLFDSGASGCFVGQSTVKRLGLDIRPSCLKSVATAAGSAVSILGTVTLQLQLGPAVLDVCAHILPSLLAEAHVILGQDFMKSNNVLLDYSASRCILNSDTAEPVILLNQFASSAVSRPPDVAASAVESNRLSGQISAAMAFRLLKRDPRGAYIALIKPYEVTPPEIAPAAAEQPSAAASAAASAAPVPSATPNLAHVPTELQSQLQQLVGEFQDIFSETPRLVALLLISQSMPSS